MSSVGTLLLYFYLAGVTSATMTTIDFNHYLRPYELRCHSVIVLTHPRTFELVPLLSPVEIYHGLPLRIRPPNLSPRCPTTRNTSKEMIDGKIGYYWRLKTRRTCLAHFINFRIEDWNQNYWRDLLNDLQDYWIVENFPNIPTRKRRKFETSDGASYRIRFTGKAYLNVIGDSTVFGGLFGIALFFYRNAHLFISQNLRQKCTVGFTSHISSKFLKIYFHDLDPGLGLVGISCPCNPIISEPRESGISDEELGKPPSFRVESSRFFSSRRRTSQLNFSELEALSESGMRRSRCGNLVGEILTTSQHNLPTDLFFFRNEWEVIRRLQTAETESAQSLLETLLLAHILLQNFPNTTMRYVNVRETVVRLRENPSSEYDYKLGIVPSARKWYDAIHFPAVQFKQSVNQPTTSEEAYYPTDTVGFNFMACAVRVADVSLYPFVMPFEFPTWLVLLCFAAFILPLSYHFMLKTNEDTFFIISAYFLEHGVDFKTRTRELPVFPWLVGPLALVCIVLTNAYKEIMTTEVIAPQLKVRLQTFDHVMRYKGENAKRLGIFYDTLDLGTIMYTCLFRLDAANCFRGILFNEQNDFLTRVLTVRKLEENKNQKNTLAKQIFRRVNISQILEMSSTEFWRARGCHGSVVTGKSDKLPSRLLRFKAQNQRLSKSDLYTGNENLYPMDAGFTVGNLNFLGEGGFKRAAGLLHSGIYRHLQLAFQRELLKLLSAKVAAEKPKQLSKLSITPSIQVLFYIHLAVMTTASVIFISEYSYYLYKLLRDDLVKIFQLIRRLWKSSHLIMTMRKTLLGSLCNLISVINQLNNRNFEEYTQDPTASKDIDIRKLN